MNRQVIGVIVLVLATVAAIVTPRWLNPPVVDGRALVEPPPPPPAARTCIARLPSLSAPGDGGGAAARPQPTYPVPCDDVHAGEVFHLYDPAPPAARPPSAAAPLCTEPGADVGSYLGVPVDGSGGWQPVLDYNIAVLGPDERQLAAGQRWQACVIAGGGSRPALIGSVRGTDDSVGPPAQLSLCETTVSADFTRQSSATCAGVHGTEVFAVRVPVAGDSAAALDSSCREMVVRDTGRASLLDEPDLRVNAEIYQFVDNSVRRVDTLPADGDGWARCVVQAVDGRSLTGSLRRLGAAPIPWAP